MRNLARHIAKYGTSSKNAMIHIATSAVAVSIAVVIISLSVIVGFRKEISSLISDTVSDITISNPYGERQAELHPIHDNDSLRNIISSTGNVAHFERYALRSGIIRGEKGAVGVALKGIGAEAKTALFVERMESGIMPRLEEARRKEILISQSIASKIGASTGSRIEILLLEENEPRREVFKVCGIYRSALGDTGAELALTDIRNVQKLNGWKPTQISGYACHLFDSSLAMQSADIINLRLMHEYEGDENIAAISSHERHADIFGWLETHDINAAVILVIMLIVAIFNMATAMLILVLERTRMIGILKSMGMHNSTIRQIFTYRAVRIIALGVTIGNILAFILLLIQKYFHVIRLDETGYFLSEVPVAFDMWNIILTNVLFIFIIIAITHLSTTIIGRIKVADAIKYN